MLDAAAIWLLAPTAIEADLRREYPGVRIADWLRGDMTSREFIVLVEHLTDESDFKTSAPQPFGRDGDWSEAMKIAAKTHEELALNRASKYVGGDNEYIPEVFIAPPERLAAWRQAQEDLRASLDLERLLSGAIDR